MLIGINPVISPELLKILDEMGHGDEIVIADSNYPSETYGQRVVRADGVGAIILLKEIMKLIPLDDYVSDNFILMQTKDGVPAQIWKEYEDIASSSHFFKKMTLITRDEFYERSRRAYCIIASGETSIYANIIIKKGVIHY